ncbi:MAG: four helix bundle protein [Bacteroidota bacterium]
MLWFVSNKYDSMKERTKNFAVEVIRFSSTLGRQEISRIIRNQLLRSATSVAANYRAACKAQSKAAFIAKLAIVEEEADETLFWLEMLEETGLCANAKFYELKYEANQITAIITASRKTAKRNK